MEKNLIKIIAGKKLKRKILNKAKFSNKLGELLLEPLNKFKIKGKEENIDPILFSNEKIAINNHYCHYCNNRYECSDKNVSCVCPYIYV